MINLEQKLFCYLDGITPKERENKRAKTLASLSLLNNDIVPSFEEATQTVSRFLDTPISIIGLISHHEIIIKSAIGLSNLGVMNDISISRRIAKDDSYATYVIDSEQSLFIEDTYTDSFFSRSLLAQYYGIRAYVGVPLITTNNICIGILEVMDLKPRQFTSRDIEFLNLTARWCLREFEHNYLTKIISSSTSIIAEPTLTYLPSLNTTTSSTSQENKPNTLFKIKIDLLQEIIQDLKSPLTSIIGMSSVLGKEIYGELNEKQKEYIKVITDSGENLREIIEEIMTLDIFEENYFNLQITRVDLEMLGQEIIINLENFATQYKQELELTKQPGISHWQLDKKLLKKALYYLLISVITTGASNSRVRIHISEKNNTLNLNIGNYNSWLGENLGGVDSQNSLINKILAWTLTENSESQNDNFSDSTLQTVKLSYQHLADHWANNEQRYNHRDNKEMLTLLLSCYLLELHQGNIYIQGSEEIGYRYILQLPKV
jgi:signal transduction histidine kinase